MLNFLKIKSIKKYFTHEPVAVVYLFGSQATGKTNHRSDYDFGVIFLENMSKKERFNKRLEYMGFLGKIVRCDNVEVIDLKESPVFYNTLLFSPEKIFISRMKRSVSPLSTALYQVILTVFSTLDAIQ